MGVIVQIFTGIIFSVFLAAHPFYVSVCEINVNEEQKNIQVMQRIFADDFEDTLNKKYNLQLDILAMEDLSSLDSLIAAYYREHFSISLDGQPHVMNFVGSEVEEDVVWCYMEAAFKQDFKEISIHNGLLMDEIDEQNNLVHVTKNGKIKSLKLSSNKRAGTLLF